MKNSIKNVSVRKMVIASVLAAITAVLGMTPIGLIPVGPTRATTMHIPVIIGAIMEGPLVGAFVGLIFGLISMFQAITNPTPVSFVFLNPVVSILPRILIGITSFYIYNALKGLGNKRTLWILNAIWISIIGYLSYGIYTGIANSQSNWSVLLNALFLFLGIGMLYYTNKKLRKQNIEIITSAIVGTLTNTVGVLFSIYILYAESFVKELGYSVDMARKVIVGIGITNGIPETIIATIIVTNVVAALKRN